MKKTLNQVFFGEILLLNIKPDKTLLKHEYKIYSPKKKEYIN